MLKNVIKLWKQMLQLAEIETDKAKLIVESELAEGVEVFVEQDGEYVPAEDGEYEAEDKNFEYLDADTGNYDHSYRRDCGVFTLQDILDLLPEEISGMSILVKDRKCHF